MHAWRRLALAGALLLVGGRAGAQETPADSTLAGIRVTDRASGRPLAGAGIRTYGATGWTNASGIYRFRQRRPPTRMSFTVYCPARFLMSGRRLDSLVLALPTTEPVAVRVDASNCTEPRPDTVVGEFAGHFEAGFEESEFLPCASGPEPGHTAYGPTPFRAWLESSRSISWERFRGVKAGPWLGADGQEQMMSHYVRLRGRLIGPGSYGHMGVSPFLFLLDEVLEVRTPRPDDCGEPAPRGPPGA